VLYENKEDYFFEGAGDALFMGELLFYGHGFRSDKEFHENLSSLNKENIIFCRLIDPYFYHMDTCFCPINKDFAIWYPPAFCEDSRKVIESKIELFAVPEQEAKNFACNAVVLGHHVIIPANCPETKKHLVNQGFSVYECDVSEFIKAGGACKCLTLLLD
jgi:N-dimethylarginine dimethylaminohydrolase